MNFQALLQAAKVLFPNNSRLFEAAEKAAEFCKNYEESENGFNQIVKDLNLSPEFLAKAKNTLNNPAIANKINLLSPNLAQRMQETVSNIKVNSPQTGFGQSMSSSDNDLNALRDRLSKL